LAAKPKEYDVYVLSRREVTIFPKPNMPEQQTIVTYVAAGLPPASITIMKKDYTLDKEKQLIKADIEKRLTTKPEQYKV